MNLEGRVVVVGKLVCCKMAIAIMIHGIFVTILKMFTKILLMNTKD